MLSLLPEESPSATTDSYALDLPFVSCTIAQLLGLEVAFDTTQEGFGWFGMWKISDDSSSYAWMCVLQSCDAVGRSFIGMT